MTLDRIYEDNKIDKELIFIGILIVFSFLFIIRDVLQLNVPRSVFLFLAVVFWRSLFRGRTEYRIHLFL